MLFLKSTIHQNLWNLLMLVKIIVLWSWKYEIRRNVGCKIHRDDRQHTPTPRLCSSRAKRVGTDPEDQAKSRVSKDQVCIRVISSLSLHTLDSVWLTLPSSPIDLQNKSMKVVINPCFAILGRFSQSLTNLWHTLLVDSLFHSFYSNLTNLVKKLFLARSMWSLGKGDCIS